MSKLNPPNDRHSLTSGNQSQNEADGLISTRRNEDQRRIEPNYYYADENADGGYHGAANQGEQKQMLGLVLSALRKHWLLILSLNLLATALTIVYVAQKPDFYTAAARVQVNEETNPADNSQHGDRSVIVNNPTYDPIYFTTQLQILEGSKLLTRVAKTLDLENNQTFLNPQQDKRLTLTQNVQKMFGIFRPSESEKTTSPALQNKNENKLNIQKTTTAAVVDETEKYASVVARIKKNLKVMPVRDSRMGSRETRLIEIEYTHEDSQLATKIVNAIGDAYVLQNLEQKIQTNASASDFLQKRVAELQTEIRLGEERLINYSKANQVLPLDTDQNTVVQRFGDLNLKLGQAENERIAAQSAYQSALQNQMRAATAERNDPQVSGMEMRLNELRQRLAQLKTEYTDQWYEVVQTRKQIEALENQLSTIRKRASDVQIAGLEERLNDALTREKQLRSNFDSQRGEVMRQNQVSINYRIIQQEIATNKTLLDGLLQRWRENEVILNGTPNNVLVAERATVSNAPAGPERAKSVLLAFVLSLLAGGAFAFLLEWLNDSVNYSDEIEMLLGMPLLAAIPATPRSMKGRLLTTGNALKRRKKGARDSYDLDAFEKPEFSEAYLQLRTNLMFSMPGGAPQTILVTSGEESEGKTLTALNLAQSLARAGSPVLLIDADLRCPRVHLLKNLNNQNGLTTLLTSKEIDEPMIARTIQKNGWENLDFLTAGEGAFNSANLLCSEEMRELLGKFTERYAHIVIDSPPALYFADSLILSTLADAVVVVVRENQSSRQLVLKTKKTLHNVGANVVGMVMNGVRLQRGYYKKYENYSPETNLPAESDGYQFINLH